MPIATAVQRAGAVVAYGFNGQPLFAKTGQLHGYTDRAVTISHHASSQLTIYDEHGRQLAAIPGSTH